MNNTKDMKDLKTEFIRPFTEEEIDKLFKNAEIKDNIKDISRTVLLEEFQAILDDEIEITEEFNEILDTWQNFLHYKTNSIREEAWNRLQEYIPIFYREIEAGQSQIWAKLVGEYRNFPYKYDDAYEDLKKIDPVMAEKEIKTLLSRTLIGKSDVFKEYLNDRLWDSILNKYFYENFEGHVRLAEKFEEEYNRMIEEGKSKEYAYAYAQMTVEEDYIESYCRQYARIYERERAKGLDRERAWLRGHKVVEFYFENILDGDCPDEIVDKYAQLCADYLEKGETKDRAEELAYKELFPEF